MVINLFSTFFLRCCQYIMKYSDLYLVVFHMLKTAVVFGGEKWRYERYDGFYSDHILCVLV